MKVIRNQQLGFTLIEMIVSLGVFSVVITVSVGALLILIGTNEQLQKEQNVMTNLSFALDSMAREIRTGTHYYCETKNSNNNNIFDSNVDLDNPVPSSPSDKGLDADDVYDCEEGRWPVGHRYHGIAFIEGGESITVSGGRILYYYDSDLDKIYRRVGDQEAQSIVSSGIVITDMEFYVSGSDPLSSGVSKVDQALVTIFIEAKDKKDENDSTVEPYRIQTTITQRTLDI